MGRDQSRSVWGIAILISLTVIVSTCDSNKIAGIEDSLQSVPNITAIEGAESTNLTVSKGSESYFIVDISNIKANEFISAGEARAWCIQWDKPIASNNDQHPGIKLYSTKGDNNWKPINYLLSIRPYLQRMDPEITYKEIQIAIWSLLDFPKFDLNELSINELPTDMVRDGRYDFNRPKAEQIINHVRDNFKSYEYNSSSTFAVVAEMNTETQTVIVESGETVWAYGQYSFREQDLREQLGITGTGKGQWGWIFELETIQATTQLIAGGGDDDGAMAADEVGMIIGSLDMSRSNNTLEVKYSVSDDYLIGDLHLWVGCSLEEFPWVGQTGNVAPGQFPYHFDSDPVNSHTFIVNLSEMDCSGNVFVSAHAGDLFIVEEIELPNEPQISIEVFEIEIFEETAEGRDDPSGGHFVSETFANAINDMGVVVGSQILIVCLDEFCDLVYLEDQGYIWSQDDGLWSLPMMNETGDKPVSDNNNHQEVAGFIAGRGAVLVKLPQNPPYSGVPPTEIIEIGGILGGDPFDSDAIAINDNSQVVGYISDSFGQIQAYIWDEINGVNQLGVLPGQSESRATDINNAGKVVGWSQNNPDDRRYFMWDESSGLQDLGSEIIRSINDHGVTSSHLAINNHGQSVNGDEFLYDPYLGAIELTPPAGWSNCKALDINNNSQVSGTCINPEVGRDRAVLWSVRIEYNQTASI